MSETYCKEADFLLTEEMIVSVNDKPKYIQIAQEEIDGKLGFVYVVPIDISETSTLPENQKMLLKTMAQKLASGRLLMGNALGGQSESVNAYALYLIKAAEMDLMAVANGQIDLHAPRVDQAGTPIGLVDDPTLSDQYARVPSAWNPDSVSPVTVFEKKYMSALGPDPTIWNPDDNVNGLGANVDKRS